MQLRTSPGSWNVQLFAQAPARPSVIADRHNGRQIGNARQACPERPSPFPSDVLLQAVEHGGQSGASAHGDDSHGAQFSGCGIARHRINRLRQLKVPLSGIRRSLGADIRIKQLGETRIVGQAFEVASFRA